MIKEIIGGGLLPGKDIIEYAGLDDLIDKIGVYLYDDCRREGIANNGNRNIIDKYEMKQLLMKLVVNA